MVSALDSGSKGPVIELCSWARHFTVTVPLSTQEYKWVPANCQGNLTKCWKVTCDGLAFHPGGVAIFLVASCYGNWDKLGHLAKKEKPPSFIKHSSCPVSFSVSLGVEN